MKEINVLFSSAGRRVELINSFRRAKEELGIEGKLIGVDIDDLAPALKFVDKSYIVPRLNDDRFIPNIIEICKTENIALIIPTIDTELELYAKNKELIEAEAGTKVMVSDIDFISIVRDKIKTCEFLAKNGVEVPKLITNEDIEKQNIKFPVFIKPLDGSSSINNFKVNDMEELLFFKNYVKKPMVQEFADGVEYCVDVFCDFDSNIISAVPKLRLSHRSGEITKAKIVKDREIINIAKKIVEISKPIGEINFDCIKTNNGVKVIEINGRFAGGAPISFKAGADSPSRLYQLLQGKELNYSEEYSEDMIAMRFDDAVYINL